MPVKKETQQSHEEREGYKSLKLAGQEYAIIVATGPKRKFYKKLANEYSDFCSENSIPKIPIFSPFFLRFLFYINLYFLNIVFI